MNWSALLLGQEIRNHASSLFFWKFQLNYALGLLDMWLWLCVTGVISHISFTFSSWGKVSLHKVKFIASFSFSWIFSNLSLTVWLEHALFCCCFWVNTLFEINTILLWVCKFCVWKLHHVLIVNPVLPFHKTNSSSHYITLLISITLHDNVFVL